MQATQDFLQPVLDQTAAIWNWSKGALYNTLQWTTSWLYYGLGASLGLVAGSFDAVLRYTATVTADALEWAGIQPPTLVRQAQKVHFGADTLQKVSASVKEKVPAAAPLVEGVAPAPAVPPAPELPAKGASAATNMTNAVKEKAAGAAETIKKAPEAIPGLGGAAAAGGGAAKAARTSAPSSGGPPSSASTQVHVPGMSKPVDISFTRG